MKLPMFSLAAAIGSALLFSSCSSGPQVNSAVLSAATSRDVAQSTSEKMSAARPLDLNDLENLVSKGVPSTTIIAYLNSVRETSTDFSPAQLEALRQAGADDQLIGFLRESGNFALRSTASSPSPASRGPAGQYTNSRAYQDEQPFAYNEPAIDGFYDSGYEESLYSPFSFN
ncbi:MAG: hypothetical protein ACKOAS_05445 [Verrucomicrobiota bacterium]|jgi:hypothetical protein